MTPALKKLRYRPGLRVAVHGAPVGFETAVRALDVTRGARDLDLVQAFFTRKAHAARALPRLRASLAPKGILWLCYPKARALGTDLDRDVLRKLAAAKGLTSVAIVSIDPVWSALRVKPSSTPSTKPR